MVLEYEVEDEFPSSHSTNPAGIDLQADPAPCLAKIESCFSDNFSPAAATAAKVRAAKPEEDEERPVPDGKLLLETTLALITKPANFLILSRCLIVLIASSLILLPSIMI